MKRIAPLVLVLGVSGCGLFEPRVCTSELRAGIDVTVLDSVNDGAVTADEVTVVVRDGPYADSLRVTGAAARGSVPLAFERAGRYTVEVRASGYLPWVQERVEVTEDECHVTTVRLVARLQRA